PAPSQEAYRIPDDGDTEPEDTKPQETKPEETKPEETKPEETKPEETKPEETKPEETKPEETTPQETEPPATEPPATEPPASAYIIPDSDSRYLSAEDYQYLSDWELVLARNEIFARHGRRFSNADIQEYFDGCSWYKGTIDPDDFDSSVFNDYELKNIQLLKAASDAR
ncbi:MAG: YARHG domain-containing protein, partial [Faecousia sp.]